MYTTIKNSNYGIANTTYADYIAISNPDFIPYDITSASICHTGSVDCYRYNRSADGHVLLNTLYRPPTPVDVLLTAETGDILNTESPSLELALDSGIPIEVQNSFGASLDLIDNKLVVGCPYFFQTIVVGNITMSVSGSAVYVFDINSTGSLLQMIPNISSVTSSFGSSVAINNDWLAIGSPLENSSSGSVYIYNNINGNWNLYQSISASNTIPNSNFGYSIKLNKDDITPSGRLVVGCGNPASQKAFFFELSGSQWVQTYTFTPNYNTYPLTFGNYNPYQSIRNKSSSFGSSVSTYGDSVIIGEYLDRTIYEYSGSSQYQQGSISVFQKCHSSSSIFSLSYKTYGNENVLRNNNFGYSVDIFDTWAVAGIPRTNQNSITPNYIENTLNQYYQCEDNNLTSLNGQVALFSFESGSWGIKNIFQNKKEYLSPYRVFGRNVAVADYSMVVGAPLIISASTPTNINIITTQSNNIVLDDICGKSYIYNLNNLHDTFHIGNIFYRNGKMVLITSGSIFQDLFTNTNNSENYSYNLNFKGNHTIYEKQIICSILPGEFNVSTNPTSLVKVNNIFDLNSNGQFDYEDVEIILRYMEYKNTQVLGLPFSTDWSSSLSLGNDELSLINYYKSSPTYNDDYISSQLLRYISKWDGGYLNIQSDLDVNGDNIIDVRDMNIIWKYFSNRLNQKNYSSYITANSNKKTLSQVIDYLDRLSGRNKIPTINPEFLNYKNKITADPTGSFLSPMISSIGLYNDTLELIAVAKLGTPIQNNGQLPLNFAIKIDF